MFLNFNNLLNLGNSKNTKITHFFPFVLEITELILNLKLPFPASPKYTFHLNPKLFLFITLC